MDRGGRYSMGRGIKIPWIGGQNTMGRGVNMSMVGGARYHG
jgi:hypothetical protein